MADKPQPLYLTIEAKKDAYVWASDMTTLAREGKASRLVRYSGILRSLQMTGGGWLKPIEAFHPRHVETKEAMGAFLDECESKGVRMPSSYNAIFRHLFYSPRIPYSINAGLSPYIAGAWEEAKTCGFLPLHYRQYDVNGAYRWAARQGLPNPSTFRATDRVSIRRPGIYVLNLTGKEGVPYPYSRPGWAAVSDIEIESYGLTWTAQRFGVTWSDYWPSHCVDAVLDSCSFGSDMAKNFWGSWAARMPVENFYPKKGNTVLQNPIALNLVWAHRVISLVKLHVWQCSQRACHVFCDSIITTDILPTSCEVGGWKLVAEYPKGVYIGGAGVYGPSPNHLHKHSGKPHAGTHH